MYGALANYNRVKSDPESRNLTVKTADAQKASLYTTIKTSTRGSFASWNAGLNRTASISMRPSWTESRTLSMRSSV
ncbi:hypothetical protein ARTHRO9V_280054 [Arthrobacter sp. 9V]|nr:hypothetical protein ARTHRO9V_280054 [Arthrobacter sp. 9V]